MTKEKDIKGGVVENCPKAQANSGWCQNCICCEMVLNSQLPVTKVQVPPGYDRDY